MQTNFVLAKNEQPVVSYLCKGKSLSKSQLPEDHRETCEKTIISLSSGKKVELENNKHSKNSLENKFNEVKLIHDNVALVEVNYSESSSSKIINLLNPNESFLISSSTPSLSSNGTAFFMNGHFDILSEVGGAFSSNLFTLDKSKNISHEILIAYSEDEQRINCKAKKCYFSSYLKEGVFQNFKWESADKLVSKRCKVIQKKQAEVVIPAISNECTNVWIEKKNNTWKASGSKISK